MLKDVSSPLTAVNKFISPLIFLGVIIYALYQANLVFHLSLISSLIDLALVAIILFLLVIPAMKVKRVAFDENYLYVSNYFKEIQVPLSNIAEVSQSFWQRGRSERVSIRFKEPTVFGGKIFFYPSLRILGQGEHPVVDEIKQAIGNQDINSFQQFSRLN